MKMDKAMQDRIGTWVTAVVMILFGLGLLGWLGRDVWRQRASASWPSAPAVLTSAGVRTVTKKSGTTSPRYYPAVEYTFEVAGQRYTGNRIQFLRDDGRDSHDQAEAMRIAGEWRDKDPLVAFYDPTDPESSCLEAGGELDLSSLGLGLLFGGGSLLVGLWMLKGARADLKANQPSVPG